MDSIKSIQVELKVYNIVQLKIVQGKPNLAG